VPGLTTPGGGVIGTRGIKVQPFLKAVYDARPFS